MMQNGWIYTADGRRSMHTVVEGGRWSRTIRLQNQKTTTTDWAIGSSPTDAFLILGIGQTRASLIFLSRPGFSRHHQTRSPEPYCAVGQRTIDVHPDCEGSLLRSIDQASTVRSCRTVDS